MSPDRKRFRECRMLRENCLECDGSRFKLLLPTTDFSAPGSMQMPIGRSFDSSFLSTATNIGSQLMSTLAGLVGR